MMEKTDIRSLNLEELKAWFKERGEKPFRGRASSISGCTRSSREALTR